MTPRERNLPKQTSSQTAARLVSLVSVSGLRHRLALPVLLYFLAVLLPVQFDLGPLTMTGVRLVLIVIVVPLTVQLFSGAYGKLLLTDVMFLLHVIWMAITLAINNPEQAFSNAGSTGIEFFGGYVLGRACIRSREDFVGMIRLIAFVVVCCVPFAVYELLTGTAVIIKILDALPGLRSLADIDIGERLRFERVQMVFAHPIHFGLFCAILLPLFWVGMKAIYSDALRIFVTLAIGISGFTALSSGALLAIFLQIGLIVWAYLFRASNKRWMILGLSFCLVYLIIDIASNRTPIMVFLSYATFSPHTAYWRTIIFDYGMQNVWANPVIGIGLNDWFRPGYMHSSSVDNFWLLTGMRYGIPGFALLVIGYLSALWKIGRRQFDEHSLLWQFRRAWMFSFVGLTFTLCTVHVWHNLFSFIFFMFGAGIWLLTAEPEAAISTADTAASASRTTMPYSRQKLLPVAPKRVQPHSGVEPIPPQSVDTRQLRYSRFGPMDKSDGQP